MVNQSVDFGWKLPSYAAIAQEEQRAVNHASDGSLERQELHRGSLFCQEQCLEVLCEVAGPDMSRERPRTRRASIVQWRTLLPKKGAVGFRRVVLCQDHQRGSFTISGGIEFEAVGGLPASRERGKTPIASR